MGSWAVKQVEDATGWSSLEITEGAAFQEAARAAGISTPAVRRAPTGEVLATVGDVQVRLHEWVDLRPLALDLDATGLGRLIAGLHQVEFAGTVGTHPWYEVPVGEKRWRTVVRELHAAGAPFTDELEALVPELVALERSSARRRAPSVPATGTCGPTTFDAPRPAQCASSTSITQAWPTPPRSWR